MIRSIGRATVLAIGVLRDKMYRGVEYFSWTICYVEQMPLGYLSLDFDATGARQIIEEIGKFSSLAQARKWLFALLIKL